MTTTEEDLKKKPHRLKDLTVTAIAAVDRGANPGAHVVLMKRDSNGKPMTKPEIYACIEKYATAKHPDVTREQAIARVALEPEVVEAYRRAEYAPIVKSETAPVLTREEAMLTSPTVQDFIAKVRRIQKQGAGSLAQLATDKLLEIAADRRRQNPKLSDMAALVVLLDEGINRPDATPPDPVRFLVQIATDQKNSMIRAKDALQLDSLRAQFAEHGIAV